MCTQVTAETDCVLNCVVHYITDMEFLKSGLYICSWLQKLVTTVVDTLSERACNDLESLSFCFSYWVGDYVDWGASVLCICEKEEQITKT